MTPNFQQVAGHHRHVATDTLLHAVGFYADFYSGLYAHVAREHGCFGHDVLAFVYLTDPQLFGLENGRVRVALEGLAQGQTTQHPPFQNPFGGSQSTQPSYKSPGKANSQGGGGASKSSKPQLGSLTGMPLNL